MELPDFYEELVQRTGYAVMLEQKNTVEDRTRLENVHEVLSSIQNYLENAVDEPSLAGFLDEIALYTDLDSHDPSEGLRGDDDHALGQGPGVPGGLCGGRGGRASSPASAPSARPRRWRRSAACATWP